MIFVAHNNCGRVFKAFQAAQRALKHGSLILAIKGKKLLRETLPRQRPQPRTTTASQNYRGEHRRSILGPQRRSKARIIRVPQPLCNMKATTICLPFSNSPAATIPHPVRAGPTHVSLRARFRTCLYISTARKCKFAA
ncbi:hypothetical protein ALP69_102206 [Pseudomonas syringae pv. aceris]|nr:hypothetical protein ALP69_102206 [Pseudomonas syringae pv. aceris]